MNGTNQLFAKAKPAIDGSEAIHIEDGYHGYYNPTKNRVVTVLNDIDLVVKRGEFVSLVGPSGCGKSTLLKLISGQEAVQKARHFEVLGRPAGFPSRDCGVVFQAYSLAPHLTVLGNIMLGLEFQANLWQYISPAWRKESREMARGYLDSMRLGDVGDKYPHELSGGMRQRVSIAQALITIDRFNQPQILCMDEPYGALDASTREDLQIFILKLWEKYKKTIFFVTHDLTEAVFLGSRVIVLSQFWKSDLPEATQEGSRIRMDIPVSQHAMSTEVKKTKEFEALVQQILEVGFNPKQRQHVAEFNADMRHPNAFQTLSIEQHRAASTPQSPSVN